MRLWGEVREAHSQLQAEKRRSAEEAKEITEKMKMQQFLQVSGAASVTPLVAWHLTLPRLQTEIQTVAQRALEVNATATRQNADLLARGEREARERQELAQKLTSEAEQARLETSMSKQELQRALAAERARTAELEEMAQRSAEIASEASKLGESTQRALGGNWQQVQHALSASARLNRILASSPGAVRGSGTSPAAASYASRAGQRGSPLSDAPSSDAAPAGERRVVPEAGSRAAHSSAYAYTTQSFGGMAPTSYDGGAGSTGYSRASPDWKRRSARQ